MCGTANVHITVTQAKAQVPVYIVPDHTQSIPLLVGQPFTEQRHVTVVRRQNTLCRFEEHQDMDEDDNTLSRIQVPTLPQRRVSLWAKDSTVIPPNYVGSVGCFVQHFAEADVFVDAQYRPKEGEEHCIPSCVAHATGDSQCFVPVANVSNSDLSIRRGQVVARGDKCNEDLSIAQQAILQSRPNKCEPLDIGELNVGLMASSEERQELLRLVEEYPDCFARPLSEIGLMTASEMNIELTTDKSVTYRPYRLSYTEREKVRSIVDELKSIGIVTDSSSEYARPVLLVRKKTGEERLCIDYRALNRITRVDKYPLPLNNDELDRLQGKKCFSSLDFALGYYQVPVAQAS